MQNALIRKKLEEQRENYRKRQEQEKQENAKKNQQDQPTSSSEGNSNPDQNISNPEEKSQPDSPSKKAPTVQSQRQHAPSPSIFALTPTSVLRKMTAEKESDASKNEKRKIPPQTPQQHQQMMMRNQQPQSQQAPFMGNNISPMDRLKMAQNDASGLQFGSMNAWNTQPMQDMKPIGEENNFEKF